MHCYALPPFHPSIHPLPPYHCHTLPHTATHCHCHPIHCQPITHCHPIHCHPLSHTATHCHYHPIHCQPTTHCHCHPIQIILKHSRIYLEAATPRVLATLLNDDVISAARDRADTSGGVIAAAYVYQSGPLRLPMWINVDPWGVSECV
jgi:hypothetical protein